MVMLRSQLDLHPIVGHLDATCLRSSARCSGESSSRIGLEMLMWTRIVRGGASAASRSSVPVGTGERRMPHRPGVTGAASRAERDPARPPARTSRRRARGRSLRMAALMSSSSSSSASTYIRVRGRWHDRGARSGRSPRGEPRAVAHVDRGVTARRERFDLQREGSPRAAVTAPTVRGRHSTPQ